MHLKNNYLRFLVFFLLFSQPIVRAQVHEIQISYSPIKKEEAESVKQLNTALFFQQTQADFEQNEAIPSRIKKKIRPYVLPSLHPLKPVMDALFARRVTQNEQTFFEAGFITLHERPRTFVRVAAHPLLSGHLIKAYLDNDLRRKHHKESWLWLVRRCEGARKIASIIERKNIQYFTVAKKWIYPLPADPSPPNDRHHTRHLAVLLVTDMQLTSSQENKDAWYHLITREHLEELYTIISLAKGSSYRPDNIWYTRNGTFAFIDTEYPDHGPDFKSIRSYLRPSMLKYWDSLVKGAYLSE